MAQAKRSERIGAIAKILSDAPNRIVPLSEFCQRFGAARASLSEDVKRIAEAFKREGLGEIDAVAGAGGGVRYRPIIGADRAERELFEIAARLSQPNRLLPGDFLYTNDVTCDPKAAARMGRMLARGYYDAGLDFVLTMETKGIPVALATAEALNAPLVIARRETKAYEGSAVKINYRSGTTGGMETMSLARRAVAAGQRALIVDDFVKGGGTLRGMIDLMAEFGARVEGIGVVIATREPERKLVSDFHALFVLQRVDREGERAVVAPSGWALGRDG